MIHQLIHEIILRCFTACATDDFRSVSRGIWSGVSFGFYVFSVSGSISGSISGSLCGSLCGTLCGSQQWEFSVSFSGSAIARNFCANLVAPYALQKLSAGKDGNTAVIWAARHGHEACLRVLAEKGADLNAATADGSTAVIIRIPYIGVSRRKVAKSS